MDRLGPYERLSLFLERYGEKGLIVLKAAYDVSQDPNIDHRLGDFSYKHLVLRLLSMGFNYNPVNMLRIMEREFEVIEKTYSSSNQTWWRFIDIESVRRIIAERIGLPFDQPEIKALLIKYRSLEPSLILDSLRKMLAKETLSMADKEFFTRFVFNTLDKIVSLIHEMEKYEEVFAGELNVLKEIISLADLVSSKLDKPKKEIYSSVKGNIYVNTRASLVKDNAGYSRDSST